MKERTFDSRNQEVIFDRLRRLVGEGPAAFWADACWLMSTPDSPVESITHLVGHLLREVESAIRDVLQPAFGEIHPGKKKGSSGETHQREVSLALKALGIEPEHPAAVAWLRLPGRDNEYGLSSRAHRDSLAYPRPADSDFRAFWKEMQTLLGFVLDRLEASDIGQRALIERLQSKEAPSADDVKALRNQIPNSFIAHQQFFAGLNWASWIRPLAEAGLFRRPPGAVTGTNERGTFIAYPGWPEGVYLERMAALPEACDPILEVLSAAELSDNLRVHYHFAGMALAVPIDPTIPWVLRETSWIETQRFIPLTILARRLGEVAARLAVAGRVDEAINLARALLSLAPSPNLPESDEKPYPMEPAARIGVWDYREILRAIWPELVKAGGLRAIRALCELLEVAIIQASLSAGESGADTSYIWRPAVEQGAEDHGEEIVNSLITTIRVSAESYSDGGASNLAAVLTLLAERRKTSSIFDRLSLHLVRVCSSATLEIQAEWLTDRRILDGLPLRHEYTLLVGLKFDALPAMAQAQILSLIEAGPVIAAVEEHSEKEIEDYRMAWTRDRLAPIAEYLPPDWSERYRELVETIGDARHPEYPSHSSYGFIGTSSPIDANELRAMVPSAIIEFLRKWEPQGDFFGPSPEGLGSVLSEVVSEDPRPFYSVVDELASLDPTYVRGVLSGFHARLLLKQEIDWGPVLALCRLVVNKSTDPGAATDSLRFDRDIGWKTARETAAQILESGVEAGPSCVPYEHRAAMWVVVEGLVADKDPTLTQDEERLDRAAKDGRPVQHGARGRATRLVIRYAVWLKTHLGEVWTGFAEAPEVEKILRSRLDPSLEPAVTIRAAYGEQLIPLLWLDRAWVESICDLLFPDAPALHPYREVAWSTYLVLSRPARDFPKCILREYSRVVQELSGEESGAELSPAQEALAAHLVLLYAWGEIGLGPEEVMGRFLERASLRLGAHAVRSAGRNLGDKGKVPDVVVVRLQDLWQKRKTILGGASIEAHRSELSAFSSWFGSGAFPPSWVAEELLGAYERAEAASADYVVLKRLASIATEIPTQAAEILRRMASLDGDALQFSALREEVEAILNVLLQEGSPSVATVARETINRLAAKGCGEFRALLRKCD